MNHDAWYSSVYSYPDPLSLPCVCTIYTTVINTCLQILEEEAYTCARSCGCPASFQLREGTWQDVLTWIKGNRVEWLAGITTGLTAVPTAVAFAILAGVSPAVGLRGTWIIMLVMSLFGGERPCAARDGVARAIWCLADREE